MYFFYMLFEPIFMNYEWNHLIMRTIETIAASFGVLSILLTVFYVQHEKTDKQENGSQHRGRKRMIASWTLSIVWGFLCFSCIFDEPGINNGVWLYYGQTEGEKPDGFGRFYDTDRNILYIGEFKNGKYEGRGKHYKVTGYKGDDVVYADYEGEYSRGKKNGYGKQYIYLAGEIKLRYSGEWLNDQWNGHCAEWNEYYDNGKSESVYSGGFAYDKLSGYGEYVSFNEDGQEEYRYRGTYWQGKRSGKAIMEYISTSDDKCVYVGEMKDGYRDGMGATYHGDGERWSSGKYEKEDLIEEVDCYDDNPYPYDCIWDSNYR